MGEVRGIIQHVLKLEFSPSVDPRPGWMTSVTTARTEIDGLLRSDPGLRPRLAEVIAEEAQGAAKTAAREVQFHGEAAAAGEVIAHGADRYTQAPILGDWFPGESPA